MILDVKFAGTRDDGETYEATGQYDTEKNELKINQNSRWTPTVTKNDKKSAERFNTARKKNSQ